MTDITAFLVARLDEDATMAHAASAFYDDADENGVSWDGHEGESQNGSMHFWPAPHLGVIYDVASGRHINRHDPARVLSEVAAKRALLAEHVQVRHAPVVEWSSPMYGCTVCDAGCQCYPGVNGSGTEGCNTVRIMAAVYAEHPDYKEEWRA
jgi:hypothetical protein